MKGLIILCFCCLGAHSFAQHTYQQVDRLLTLYHQYDQLNGSVLIAENGTIRYQKTFGRANFEWNIKNTIQTKFKTASVSKLFTVILCFQLFQENKLSPDTKIKEWIPEFTKGTDITVQQLLSHTSGLIDHREMRNNYDNIYGRSRLSTEQMLNIFKDSALLFKPGTNWHYSNFGYNLLAILLERLSKQNFGELLRDKIFKPAGMDNTSTMADDSLVKELAYNYERVYTRVLPAQYYDASMMKGTGSIITTTDNLFKFFQALKAGKLLQKKYTDKLYNDLVKDENNNLTTYSTWFFKNKTDKKDSTRVAYWAGNHFGTHALVYDCYERNKLVIMLLNVKSPRLFNIADDILSVLFKQPYQMPKDAYVRLLAYDIEQKGVVKAIEQFRLNKKQHNDKLSQQPRDLNRLGYHYFDKGKFDIAIEIFKLNLEYYPKEADFYDSLGEAYCHAGDKANAVINLKKSLELNSQNEHAKELLKEIDNSK